MKVFRALRKRNTALLLSAQLVSTMGSIMQTTALALYVLHLTGNAVLFASVLAVAIIPRLFGPFTGVLTDRRSRKRLLVALDIAAGAVTLCFAVWHQATGGLPLFGIYALVLTLSALQTFYDPAISAIIPEIVDKNALEEVNSASSFLSSIAYIAAPILAGVLYAANGLFLVMLINCISFIAAAAIEAFMRYACTIDLKTTTSEPIVKSMKEGLATVFKNREILLIVVISIIANLALNPIFTVGMPYIMKQVMKVSDELFGLSQSLLFVGPVIGSFIAGLILKKVDYKRMLIWILMLDGALISVLAVLVAFGRITLGTLVQFVLINFVALVIVATIVLAGIAVTTAMQKIVPGRLMGRVSGVDVSFSLLAIPLGQMLFGLGTALLSTELTLLIFAVLAFSSGFAAFLLYKPMLNKKAGKPPPQISPAG
jgi:MFS family permease